MGIPTFFRWLIDKYPNLISHTCEPRESDGTRIVCDNREANPNGEYDNLYLDMNGIIHPCAHPEVGVKPNSIQDMIDSIYEYLDMLFAITRPRKLIYMAIDGVAPRAKMNQQRSRRFRSALDSRMSKIEEQKKWQEDIEAGRKTQKEYEAHLEMKASKFKFDSNCITPGTEFMDTVALSLRSYVANRISTDPAWKNVKIIISDASVPGEGEHKIMDYIRYQRAQPDYNPNLKHILCGLDADLIMLGLATHEPNFDILREFVPTRRDLCHKCGRPGHRAFECDVTDEMLEQMGCKKDFLIKDYQILHLHLLKEYLELELKVETPFGFEIDRMIDDFIFICFFVGNDFLPHLPSLEIVDGALDRILHLYREILPTFDDYIVENGTVNLVRLATLFASLAKKEEEMIHRKLNREKAFLRKRNRNTVNIAGDPESLKLNQQVSTSHKEAANALLNEIFSPVNEKDDSTGHVSKKQKISSNKAAAQKVSSIIQNESKKKSNKEAAKLIKKEMDKKNKKNKKKKEKEVEEEEEEKEKVKVDQDDDEIFKQEEEEDEKEDKSNLKRLKKSRKRERDEEEEEQGEESTETTTSSHTLIEEEEEEEVEEVEEEEKILANDDDLKELFIDMSKDIKFEEEGWKDRYYNIYFKSTAPETIEKVCKSYLEGLVWVLEYYFRGCSSWDWYYPYHYAPFVMDFAQYVGSFEYPTFKLGEPFKPFNQLMSVLPTASAQFVPKPYQKLMGIEADGDSDFKSPISHFYPMNFVIDRAPTQPLFKGVCILPFIDEKLLLSTLKTQEDNLSQDEQDRNALGHGILFIHKDDPIESRIKEITSDEDFQGDLELGLTSSISNIDGRITKNSDLVLKKMPPLMDAVSYRFENPDLPQGHEFKFCVLPGAIIPPKTIGCLHATKTQNNALRRVIDSAVATGQYKDNMEAHGWQFGKNSSGNSYMKQYEKNQNQIKFNQQNRHPNRQQQQQRGGFNQNRGGRFNNNFNNQQQQNWDNNNNNMNNNFNNQQQQNMNMFNQGWNNNNNMNNFNNQQQQQMGFSNNNSWNQNQQNMNNGFNNNNQMWQQGFNNQNQQMGFNNNGWNQNQQNFNNNSWDNNQNNNGWNQQNFNNQQQQNWNNQNFNNQQQFNQNYQQQQNNNMQRFNNNNNNNQQNFNNQQQRFNKNNNNQNNFKQRPNNNNNNNKNNNNKEPVRMTYNPFGSRKNNN
eukprot:gene7998-9841_t